MPVRDNFDRNDSAGEAWLDKVERAHIDDGEDLSKGLTISQLERSNDMTDGGRIKPYGHTLSSGDAIWAMCEFLGFPMPSECTFKPEATLNDAFLEGYNHAFRVAGICLQKMVQLGVSNKPKDRPWPECGLYKMIKFLKKMEDHAVKVPHPIKRDSTKEEGVGNAQGTEA